MLKKLTLRQTDLWAGSKTSGKNDEKTKAQDCPKNSRSSDLPFQREPPLRKDSPESMQKHFSSS
jgi:hypothetical protein